MFDHISPSPFHTTTPLNPLAFASLWFSRGQDIMKIMIVHRQAHRTLQLPSVTCRPHSAKHASGTPQTDRETRPTPPSRIPYLTLDLSILSPTTCYPLGPPPNSILAYPAHHSSKTSLLVNTSFTPLTFAYRLTKNSLTEDLRRAYIACNETRTWER